jgi:hypothetical protein
MPFLNATPVITGRVRCLVMVMPSTRMFALLCPRGTRSPFGEIACRHKYTFALRSGPPVLRPLRSTFRILRESLCMSFSAREGGEGVGYLRLAMRVCVSVLHLHRDVQTLQVLAPETSSRSAGHAPAYHIQEQSRHVPSIAKAARCLGDPSPPARISSGGTWRRS